ncbi:MAG: hypothetical protein Q9191_005535 [Dirinaria sp. TL-2023a]
MKTPTHDVDWEAFPPTMKRKNFSTLERLRHAQACPPSKPSSAASWQPSLLSAPKSPSRPPLNRSKSSSYLRPSGKRAKRPLGNDHLTTADAQWFLRLPEKVQRRHFTPDEQQMLAGQREELMRDAGHPTFYQRGRLSNRSVPSLRRSSSSSSVESALYFEAEQDPIDSAVDMDDAMLETFRWVDDNDDLDLTLDDYHAHVVQAAGVKSLSDRRPSFRRDYSGTFLQTHSPRIPSPLSRPSRETTRSSNEHRHHRHTPHAPATPFLPIHQNRPSAATDSAAAHYQDPCARMKLRLYLSPSKFDEAVEFGFPSLSDTDSLPPSSRPSLSNHRYKTSPPDLETFFDDDSPSLLNALDTDDDSASLPDMDSPVTPSDAFFAHTHRLPTTSNKAPSSSSTSKECTDLYTSLKPKIRYLSPEPPYLAATTTKKAGAGVGVGGREMTLRMTLTRPDLRDPRLDDMRSGDQPEVYSVEEVDPFQLEELPPARDGHTLWDPVPREGGKVKKLWRRISGQ